MAAAPSDQPDRPTLAPAAAVEIAPSIRGGPVARRANDRALPEREPAIQESKGPIVIHESEEAIVMAELNAPHQPGPLDGRIDAGGPYGGPGTFEGDTLTFIVSILDPTIIFLRYDFNGDGKFDFPDQTGGGTMGKWTTLTTITKTFYDNYFGDIVVEGWDGVSVRIKVATGDNLAERTDWQYMIGYGGYNFAWQFRAKEDMTVTHLGHYHYFYPLFDQGLWTTTGVKLASCQPAHLPLRWNWCALPSPVPIQKGRDYRISIQVASQDVAVSTPADTGKIEFQGTYFCLSPSTLCFPATFWTNTIIPLIDFRWRQVLTLPDTARDTAFVEVNNVAPNVSGISVDPTPTPEGTSVNLMASFDDPGLDDTWESRWTFAGGRDTGWMPVSKVTGGARVLILHSWTGDIVAIRKAVADACGWFCLAVDSLDFGPLGENRVPTLDELRAYDVVLVSTNWGPIPDSNAVGDRLAEYMDAAGTTGGGIMMMAFAWYNNDVWGVGGRWETEKSPMPRGAGASGTATLGTIYEPGHPILEGVTSLSSGSRHAIFNVTSGASRIADWTDGTVLAATKIDSGGRRACGLNLGPAVSGGGDSLRLISNAIRYCSRQPDPALRTMPFVLDLPPFIYPDDDPATATHEDAYTVRLEVRDDDNGKFEDPTGVLIYRETFDDAANCDWTAGNPLWPSGWTPQPTYGWRCQIGRFMPGRGPQVAYYYNDFATSDLTSPTFDLSAYSGARVVFDSSWRADYPFGDSRGLLDASVDGGTTYPIPILEYRHNDPGESSKRVSWESSAVGAEPDVVLRFRYESEDDWWWAFDNFEVYGFPGEVMDGLGSGNGTITVTNVDATSVGGFDTAQRDADGNVTFKGFRIEDPALWEPTEWFAYAWDFGDGTPVQWAYKGNMTPPKFDVLLLHTLCLSGDACTEFTELRETLLALDDIASVDGFNFMNYPGMPQAPDLGLLLAHDVVVVAMNWGYFSFLPWDLARRQVGDRLAEYLDAAAGGVVTLMTAIDLSAQFGDARTLSGRYIDQDYGPFEKAPFAIGGSSLGTLVDADHEIFVRLQPDGVESSDVHSGDYAVTIGGGGQASGRNGTLLARWDDGNSAVGVKELNNGMRTVHLGLSWTIVGDDTPQLLRNAIGWVAGGIPTPFLPTITHQFGNSPPYTVDLMVIDDDMGWAWDPVSGVPVEVIPPATVSHRYITIT